MGARSSWSRAAGWRRAIHSKQAMAAGALSGRCRCPPRRGRIYSAGLDHGSPAPARQGYAGGDEHPGGGCDLAQCAAVCRDSRVSDASCESGRVPRCDRFRRTRSAVAIRIYLQSQPVHCGSLRAVLAVEFVRLRPQMHERYFGSDVVSAIRHNGPAARPTSIEIVEIRADHLAQVSAPPGRAESAPGLASTPEVDSPRRYS